MATSVYDTGIIYLIDGTPIEVAPLKIKYLREFMDMFTLVKTAVTDEEAILYLAECSRIAMKQFYPEIKTVEQLEDSVDMPTMYKLIDYAAGIKMNQSDDDKPVSTKTKDPEEESSWDKLDLAKLESEAFLLGMWKDYNELELSLSMAELLATLTAKNDSDYRQQKFLAAIQGIDLDEQTGTKKEDPWEAMKARVFSGGATSDSDDILALQGVNAAKAGFGIGMGLSYEKL